jgi:hypothetical protein
MATNSIIKVGAALFFTLVLAAECSIAQDQPAEAPQYSGFLGDYSQLQPVSGKEGVLAYVNKGVDYKAYTKVMIAPVEVWTSPSSDYKGVQPDALKRMTDNMRASFVNALKPAYPVVDQPGPGVLTVRIAITGVQPTNPPLNATDFVPIKALFNFARSASGNAPQVVEMTAEMEVLDADGKRVAEAVVTRKGNKEVAQGAEITWSQLQGITDFWGKSFRQRLDQLRGVSSGTGSGSGNGSDEVPGM